jgi:pilus assembly protein CpaE
MAANAQGPRGERGQATLELLAGIPALVLAGLVALQLLATGYSLTLADGAAEAGAMALAAGKPARPAAREALPGWAQNRAHVDVKGGRLTVRLEPPSPLHAIAKHLAVSSSTWVRRPAG